MITMTQIEYILAVDRLRHFGRAAEACNVSQPSLSAQIQKAEDLIEFPIFDRSKKPIKVTDQGQRFIDQAKQVLTEHKKLIQLSENTTEPTGQFKLGVIPTLSSYVIPLFIESFSKRYPKVKLRINEHKTEDIVQLLRDDQLDAGLLVTPLNEPKVAERRLFLEPFYAFVSNDHPLFSRKRIKETDLAENSVWLLDEGHWFRDQVIRVCSLTNRHPVLENVQFESGSLQTLVHLIRRGRGYTLLPYLATQDLTSKERQTNLKPFQKPVPTREVSLVFSRSVLKTRIIDALEDEILKNLPKSLKDINESGSEIIDI